MRTRVRLGTVGLALLASVVAGACHADEESIFRITSLEGSITSGGWSDELTSRRLPAGSTAEEVSRTSQSSLRTSLFVNTRSYVVHPNFINLEVGGGPIFERAAYEIDGVRYAANKALYDFSARAEILRGKPYWGHVYFEHLNPLLTVTPGDALLTETNRVGMDFSLQRSVSPVALDLDAFRLRARGASAERRQDDRIEQVQLSGFRQFDAGSYSRFGVRGSRQESASGVASLPVQESKLEGFDFNLDTQVRLGPNGEWLLLNPINFSDQRYELVGGRSIDTRMWRASLDARGDHLPDHTLLSRARLDASDTTQNDSRSTSRQASAGLTYLPTSDLSTSVDVSSESHNATEVKGSRTEFAAATRYGRELPLGRGSVGYSVRVGKNEQQANAFVAPVSGELITFSGISSVVLRQPRVVPGTVVVSNATRTQTYVEGPDYSLSMIGLETRIERRAGGLIASGESVLIDYSYEVGGTFDFLGVSNAVDLAWQLSSYARLNLRYLDSNQKLTSGAPTYPLNSIRDLTVTAQVDVPFALGVEMTAGGLAEWEDRRETLQPYRRQMLQAYYQTQVPVFTGTGVRFGARHSKTDYEGAASIDSSVLAWDVSLWARPWYSLEFFLTLNSERDTGPAEARHIDTASARASWRYRQLRLSLTGTYVRESQGAFSRRRSHAEFKVRRDF